MKKDPAKLVIIITLICCTLALLGCGIWLAVEYANDDKPNTPVNSVEDDDNWTNNY